MSVKMQMYYEIFKNIMVVNMLEEAWGAWDEELYQQDLYVEKQMSTYEEDLLEKVAPYVPSDMTRKFATVFAEAYLQGSETAEILATELRVGDMHFSALLNERKDFEKLLWNDF